MEPASDATASEPTALKPALYALAVATLLGLLEAVKAWVAGRSAPNEFGVDEAVVTNLPWWLLWGLAAPLVFWLVRKVPPRLALRPLAVHLAASVALSAVHLTLSGAIVWGYVSRAFLTFGGQVRQLVVGYLITDLVTYWAIAAAFAGWVSYRRLQRSEREQHALQLKAARLEAEAAQLEARTTEARLDALRMELDPHFLFNALNTVSALARRGDGDEAVKVVHRLSRLLRRTLDEGLDHEISLGEELDLLNLYLDIERVRFGDRLEVQLRVEPHVRGALVPTFVLQPLVENAIRHGVSAVREAIRLEVSAEDRDGALTIRVRDSGPGFEGSTDSSGKGIGLRNTRSRLETLYGDAARLETRSPEGGGAEVAIRIPLRREEAVRVPG